MSEHWFISGANRGIGLEFMRQLKARGEEVTAGSGTMRRAPPSTRDWPRSTRRRSADV